MMVKVTIAYLWQMHNSDLSDKEVKLSSGPVFLEGKVIYH
jgi:hypothetical protein